jgi:ATP-dependent DNA helicase RecQ
MSDSSPDWLYLQTQLQSLWGYREFRPPQGEVIQTILAQKDALIVMPTGSGKSLCFQLPALLQSGLTVVISPLIALMENQTRELEKKHLPVGLIHQDVPREERKKILLALQNNSLRLLYVSPERFLSRPIWEQLTRPDLKINALILDEAHCLVEWGDSFRPTYRRLGAARQSLIMSKPRRTKIPFAAFTATATPLTQKVLEEVLGLNKPEKFLVNPYRSNLFLKVKIAWSAYCRRHLIQDFIASKSQDSGLIYVYSRKEAEELNNYLKSLNFRTAAYHAGLPATEKRSLEKQWFTDKLQFLVSTSAFGMGINKADLRWIIHTSPPQQLAQYIQEIGRAGRDGKKADILLLRSEPTGWLDRQDYLRENFWKTQRENQYNQALTRLKILPNRSTINEVKKQFPEGELSLALLHSLGKLVWIDPFTYQIIDRSSQSKLGEFSPSMQGYLNTRLCRWAFLLESFGFSVQGWRCGHCDRCGD